MRDYELVIVLNPQMDETSAAGVVDRVTKFISDKGGSITHQENWGIRKLAYPIEKFQEGNYVLTQFTFETGSAGELAANLKSSEEVIRYLLVNK